MAAQSAKTLEILSTKLGLHEVSPEAHDEEKKNQVLDREVQRELVEKKVLLAEAQTAKENVQKEILQQQLEAQKETMLMSRLKNSLELFKPGTHMYNSALKKIIAMTCSCHEDDVNEELMQQCSK